MEIDMLTMHVPGQHVTALIIFSINVFLNILVRVIKKTNKLFLWEIKWRSRMIILLLPAKHSIFPYEEDNCVIRLQ